MLWGRKIESCLCFQARKKNYIDICLIYSLGCEVGVSWFFGVLDCMKIIPRQPYFYEILDQTRQV